MKKLNPDPIKEDPKIYSGRRNGQDNGHANYMVLLKMICSKFDIHKAESIDFDLADELAREIAGKVPSDIVLDDTMTVQEILQWAESQDGPHRQPAVIHKMDNRSEYEKMVEPLKLALRDKLVLGILAAAFIATILSLIF